MSKIERIEIHEFSFEVENLGLESESEKAVYNIGYKPGSRIELSKYAVAIQADDGARGEYVTHWVGTKAALAQSLMMAPNLIGRDPEQREGIFDDLKREFRQYDHMGHGPLGHRTLGPGRKEIRHQRRKTAWCLPGAPAGLCQHLSRGPLRRPGQQRSFCCLCRTMPRTGLSRLQDSRLARRERTGRGRKRPPYG